MIALVNKINGRISTNSLVFITMLCLYFSALMYFLHSYLLFDLNICLGLILAPYIFMINKEQRSFRFFWLAVIFLVVFYFIPLRSVVFIIIFFGTLFLVESARGKITWPFMALLFLLSPLFNYITSMVGFPIRLWLSDVAGNVLKQVMKNVEIAGNVILINGNSFSVDPACTGLNMLMISFIVAIFIIASNQRKTGMQFSLLKIMVFLMLTFVLNIFCNLLRIIMLVMFRILPGNNFHDIVGILCLAIYVFLPLLFLSKYTFKKGYKIKILYKKLNFQHTRAMTLNGLLIGCTFFAGFHLNKLETDRTDQAQISMNGFRKQILETGVVKFENNNALVYFKPMKFYNAEHSPLICWSGSGYVFQQVNSEIINGRKCYTGKMIKGKEEIYTAWWFDNGRHATIEEADWRWRAFKREHFFSLVNVNATSKIKLLEAVKEVMKISRFKPDVDIAFNPKTGCHNNY